MLTLPRKLGDVLERLLEVVADELVRAVSSVKPSRRAFMQFGALRFGDAAVHHIAHEHVMETEEILLHAMDEASLGEARQLSSGVLLRREVKELCLREPPAYDCCATEHLELAQIQTVESAGEQCLHRCRRVFECDTLCGERQQLLGEERVSTGVLDDVVLKFWINGFPSELLDQARQLFGRKWFQLDEKSGRTRPAPTGTLLE